jgi:predicted ATPase
MLTRLSVKNFRLLRDVTIDVEPGKPIVLIGPNSSGKSSVIQVLDLLARMAGEGWETGTKALGGTGGFVTVDADEQYVEAKIELALSMEGLGVNAFRYLLWLIDSWPYAEELDARFGDAEDGGRELVRRIQADFWVWNERTGAKDELPASVAAERELSFHLVKNQSSYPALAALRASLAGIRVYDGFLTTPLWTRDIQESRISPFGGAVIEPCPRIDRRGLDLINALHYLQSSHPDEWDDLERSFKAEFPFVQRIEFPADPAGGRIGLGWRDRRYPGVRMHGHQMSEGMAAYLCLLAAVLSPYPAAAIAFDEPDRHLHPSALRRIVYLLEKLSERTAVFVATHSDRFLDYLSDPAGSLRVCEPSEDGVTIRRLNADALNAWREEYTMSELRAQGQLDSGNASALEP